MAVATRVAETVWTGNVARGEGTIKLTSSGACGDLATSLPTRAQEKAAGQTSPEELIAAAHSCCYATALANVLSQQGNPPEELHTSAGVTLDKAGEGFAITTVDLQVRGRVPGLDAEGFEQVAREAEQACPVSNAMRGNVEIKLSASLEGS